MLTIVSLLVEPITYLSKPKAPLDAYLFISQHPWTVNSIKPIIYPSLYILFSFGGIMISNRYWLNTVLSYVGNSSDRCGGRNTTVKMKYMSSRNCLSIVDLIKVRCVIFQCHSITFKSIVEEILSNPLQEFSDTDQFFIVLSLNPITKQFPTISNSHSHRNCRT